MSKDPAEKLELFALAANGKMHSFDVTVKPDLDLVEESHAILLKHGFTVNELDNLILSPTAPEEVPPATAEAARVSIPSVDLLDPSAYPPIPKPTDKDSLPSQTSSKILVSTHDIPLFVTLSGTGTYVPVKGAYWLKPPFPVQPKIAYKRYWIATGSCILIGPQHFSKEISTKQGMSKTQSSTLSCELGVALKGLSGRLSQTTSTSITITEEESVKESYSFDVKSGTTVVYTLWQLVEEFALVDNAGNPIKWKGLYLWHAFPHEAELKQNMFTNNSKQYVSDPVQFT